MDINEYGVRISKTLMCYVNVNDRYYEDIYYRRSLDRKFMFVVWRQSKGRWTHTAEWEQVPSFPNFETAKEHADNILIAKGYRLLAEEESQKYMVLL